MTTAQVARRVQPVRAMALAGWLALASVTALPGCSGRPPAGATGAAVRSHLGGELPAGSELKAFYDDRDYRPIWMAGGSLRPEAAILADALSRSATPERYDVSRLKAVLTQARTGDAAALARAEAMLSRAYADYIVDLRAPPAGAAAMVYVHPGLEPTRAAPARQVLEAAGRARSLRRHLAAALRTNPLYDELRQGLAAYRERWSALPRVAVPGGAILTAGSQGERVRKLRRRMGLSPAGGYDAELASAVRAFQAAHGIVADGMAGRQTIAALNAGPERYERLIRANLERARALPTDPAKRFILVDAAGATLRLYEDGEVVDTMPVIVGKPDQPTPVMAGRISFAVLNPYWNLPPDLAQVRAQRVLDEGLGVIEREHLEMLSGWGPTARRLSPQEVDWKAVAEGRQTLRMRQLPGDHNVMGDIKFMLPNKLGIYLHDTPDKTPFAGDDRRLSSGCVRLADAPRLARWLFGRNAPEPKGAAAEQRVDLPKPVPVYITYLTVESGPDGIAFRPDPYGRDAALLAELERGGPRRA